MRHVEAKASRAARILLPLGTPLVLRGKDGQVTLLKGVFVAACHTLHQEAARAMSGELLQ